MGKRFPSLYSIEATYNKLALKTMMTANFRLGSRKKSAFLNHMQIKRMGLLNIQTAMTIMGW